MQTIREAKIVIHLEQGKVELKAPDLSKVLQDQQRQIDLAKQLEEQLKRVETAQRSASSGGGGGSGGGGSGGVTWNSGFHPDKAARDHERILKVMQEEERALSRLRGSMSALAGSAQHAGEGFFRLARAAALFSASNESLQQMVRNLAQIQAYWDVFSGMLSIVQAVTNAKKALAAAQASYAAALGASTLATQAFTVALVESLAALLAFLAPFVIIAAVIGAVIWAGVAAWDALTTSEEEAAEAAKKYNEEAKKLADETLGRLDRILTLEKELEAVRRSQMDVAEQQASLANSRQHAAAAAGTMFDFSQGLPSGAEKSHLDMAKQWAEESIRFANEEIALATKRRDAEVEIRQEKIKQIESAERALETARKQKQIEEDKLRAFQAQFGMLQSFEQQQLIGIRDKLRAGQALNPFEEEFLAEKGGEGGRKAANDIRAKRGAAAGASLDFWEGTAGAGAVKDMADASAEVAKALEQLAKLLGDAGSAAEAKARYEAEMKTINEAHAKEIETIKGNADQVVKLLELITARLKELELAVTTG